MAKYPVTVASEVLNRDQRTNKEIAALLGGLSAGFLSEVRSCKKQPSVKMRERFAAVLGIPPASWDIPLQVPAVPLPAPELTKADAEELEDLAAQATTLEQVDRVLRDIRKKQGMCTDDKLLLTCLSLESRVLQQRSKCEKELLEADGALASSPGFKKFCGRLLEILASYPEALKAVKESDL